MPDGSEPAPRAGAPEVDVDGETGRLLSGMEAVWLDEERAEQAEARRVAFWEVLHRLAAEYGVEVVLTPKRSAARWDERYHPPRLLAAMVRFARPGAAGAKRRSQTHTHKRGRKGEGEHTSISARHLSPET